MGLFDRPLGDVSKFIEGKSPKRSWIALPGRNSWPPGGNRNVVLGSDVGLELGNPTMLSVSFSMWTEDIGAIEDSRITLIGPDMAESMGKSLPFGKVVIVGGKGFNADNSYDRYRDMDSIKYDIDLKGYMLRGVSQYRREWCRVSKDALRKGFSFDVLGRALIDKFKQKDFVDAVEIIFVTSSSDDVSELSVISQYVAMIVGAMNKMVEEMSLDCSSCEYQETCKDILELRKIRRKIADGGRQAPGVMQKTKGI